MAPKTKDIAVFTKPAEAAMSGKGSLVLSRRGFGYDESLEVDRGQYFRLRGHRGDEKLLRLGYVEEVKTDSEGYVCSECGATFEDELTRRGHAKNRHPSHDRRLTPREEDRFLEHEEKMNENIAPLYLEKTVASGK